MKTLVTCSWAVTVQIDVDKSRINDGNYIAELQNKVASEAARHLNWKDGTITDCEDFPQLVE